MSQFLEKIKEYLDFIDGPAYLLFMSEAGRCEYLIFIAVHLAILRTLGMNKGVALEIETSSHIIELSDCYYSYFCEGKLTEQEKCRIENKILMRYLEDNLQIKNISQDTFRQWKKRALKKDPMKELAKIVRKIKKEPHGENKK